MAFNSPGFHEIDVMALVKRWKADGHLSAVMKDASGPRAKDDSKIIIGDKRKRMAATSDELF